MTLSERLNANNDAAIQAVGQDSNLARRSAWTSGLNPFLWALLLAINGFPVPIAGKMTLTTPWLNWPAFLRLPW